MTCTGYVVESERIIDGTGAPPFAGSVVVYGGKIQEVRNSAEGMSKGSDGNFCVIECDTLMPGMMDCHVHITSPSMTKFDAMFQPRAHLAFRAAANLKRTLEAGFTTIRSTGDIDGLDIELKSAMAQKLIPGPTLYSCGQAISMTGGHADFHFPDYDIPITRKMGMMADGPDEVRKAARTQLRNGADWIKLMGSAGMSSPETGTIGAPQFTLAEVSAACEETHKQGKGVCSHCFSIESIDIALKGGVDTIEHGFLADEDCLARIRDQGRHLITSMSVGYRKEDREFALSRGIPEWSLKKTYAIRYAHKRDLYGKAYGMGVPLAPGTDAGSPVHVNGENALELYCLVDAGIPPLEVIRIATQGASEALRISDHVGTIEVGKDADLVCVTKDPLEDMGVLLDVTNIVGVIKKGELVVDRGLDVVTK